MSAPEIVIASAKRTAVGSFNGAFGNTPAHELGAAAIKARSGGGQGRARRRRRGHPRPDPRRRRRPEPGASGRDEGGHSAGEDRFRPQPIVRQRPARGRARPAADRQRRRRNHRRGRPGIDVAGPACRASAQRREDGRDEVHRLHAEGRPDRRLPRLSHGQHGGEHRRRNGRSPARSRTASPPARRTRPRPRRRPAASRTRSRPFTISTRKGDIVVADDEYHPRRHDL